MSLISTKDLKTRGITAIDHALQDQFEAAITVDGEVKYIVMSEERYRYLRECELEAALAESKANMNASRFVRETIDQHLDRIASMNSFQDGL